MEDIRTSATRSIGFRQSDMGTAKDRGDIERVPFPTEESNNQIRSILCPRYIPNINKKIHDVYSI